MIGRSPSRAEKGDSQASKARAACLEDEQWYIRQAAAQARHVLAGKGDSQIMEALAVGLEESAVHIGSTKSNAIVDNIDYFDKVIGIIGLEGFTGH